MTITKGQRIPRPWKASRIRLDVQASWNVLDASSISHPSGNVLEWQNANDAERQSRQQHQAQFKVGSKGGSAIHFVQRINRSAYVVKLNL